ncbi:uncharacterized protein LOC141906240 [Tubulanus polymorphus]|uniref:uncharacterized protein LOC141906240 n=1 Tax=Tubulanus polymorphus TaxID=672921 RepID=UPI003DA37A60
MDKDRRSRNAHRGLIKVSFTAIDEHLAKDEYELEHETLMEVCSRIKTIEGLNEIIYGKLDDTEHQKFFEEAKTEISCQRILARRHEKTILKHLDKPTPPTEPINPAPSDSLKVHLPKKTLPKFSGAVLEWQSFWDSFVAASVCKFNYLKCQLSGEALGSIAGIPLTDRGYSEAVEILQGRNGRSCARLL